MNVAYDCRLDMKSRPKIMLYQEKKAIWQKFQIIGTRHSLMIFEWREKDMLPSIERDPSEKHILFILTFVKDETWQ